MSAMFPSPSGQPGALASLPGPRRALGSRPARALASLPGPLRGFSSLPGPLRGLSSRSARVLWLEFKRSPVPWVLPLLAALTYFDPYRSAANYPPLWGIRASIVDNKLLLDFVAFAAGMSAWSGSREGRRHADELLATTAWSAWTRRMAAFTATLLWILAAFLVAVAVLYVQTARVATWGGPPLWPVAVGVVAMTTICALGFTCGVLFPGRFTAPLAAVGAVVLSFVGFREAVGSSTVYALLSPFGGVPSNDAGVFYPAAPDVAIAQVMFMGGITLGFAGVLGLAPMLRRSVREFAGRWARAAAAAVLVAGAAAAGTAFGLTGTAQAAVSGWDTIPALHDAASDRPIPYTPDCASGSGGFEVCVHPAFRGYLADAAAVLDPAAAEIAGLPGAPVRAEQVADSALPAKLTGSGIFTGTPPVWEFNLNHAIGVTGFSLDDFQIVLQRDFLDEFVGGPAVAYRDVPPYVSPPQQAVVNVLMTTTGGEPPSYKYQLLQRNASPAARAEFAAAVHRFAALSPGARHAWLASHLPALRANEVTLAQIP